MKTTNSAILISLVSVLAVAPAIARGARGGNGNGAGAAGAGQMSGVCPYGFEPGTGMGLGRGQGAGVCDGTGQMLRVQQRARDGSCLVTEAGAAGAVQNNRGARGGNPNATGTPLRDGSGKATAPGKGPKDGRGNNANCPVTISPEG